MRKRINSELPGFRLAAGMANAPMPTFNSQRSTDLHTMRAVFHHTAMALQGGQHYDCNPRPQAMAFISTTRCGRYPTNSHRYEADQILVAPDTRNHPGSLQRLRVFTNLVDRSLN